MKLNINFICIIFLSMINLTACSVSKQSTYTSNNTLTPTATLKPSPPPSPTPIPITPSPTPSQVSISFGGDVIFESHVQTIIEEKGKDYLIDEISPFFKASDISVTNLETPISVRGEKEKDKQFTFRANPKYTSILNSSGINIVSLANNHSLDYGRIALEDTFQNLLNNNISYIGAGKNINEASRPVYVEKNNIKVAFLGSSHVIPFTSWNAGNNSTGVATTYNPSRLNQEIKKAKMSSDIVICYIHWGEEGKNYPVEYQKTLAHSYIDNGADIVIGSHPHVLQGIEYYKDKIIIYSLGNLIFTDIYKKTCIASFSYSKSKLNSFKIIPLEIKNFKPTYIKDEIQSQSFFNELEAISYGVKIDTKGNVCKKQ